MYNEHINAIAEGLADIRVHSSTHPELARDRNSTLDEAIIAVRSALQLERTRGQLFCARAHYDRPCIKLED